MSSTTEQTFRIGWMQTLNGFREILETGIPASQALAKKAEWEKYLSGALGVVVFIEPEDDEPEDDDE